MKFKPLTEDTFENALSQAQQIQDELDNAEIVYKGDIEKALDSALKANRRANKRGTGEFLSILLVGQAGTGKTARVKQWCKENGLHLVQKNAQTMDIADLGGLYAPNETKTRAINLPNGAFDELDQPNTVLFLDEFNRASSQVRFTLAQLIDEHKIPDATEEGSYHYFKNLQLVIAAINPADYGVYNTEPLDIAELNRFKQVQVTPDKRAVLDYLTRFYSEQMDLDQQEQDSESFTENQGRLQLAQTILKSREFEFDDGDDIQKAAEGSYSILSPRSLTRLLELSDGTKEDLLANWSSMCNPNKKGMVERILANYQDIDDKANSIFKNNPFKSTGTENWKRIQSVLDTI